MTMPLDKALERAKTKTIELQRVHYVIPEFDTEGKLVFGVDERMDAYAVAVIEPVHGSIPRVIDRTHRLRRRAT